LTPVFKNKGEKTNPCNYRGITVSPVLLKIFEILLKNHYNRVLKPIQHKLQRGFTEKVSHLNAAFLLHEVLLDCKTIGKPLKVALLDVKAAFDTVCHESLLRKLFHDGLQGDTGIWMLIRQLYMNATSKVNRLGNHSEEFSILQGVRQGGITSSDLFKRFNHQLIENIQREACTVSLGSIYLGTPVCADDLCIITESTDDMQNALNLCTSYSQLERFQFQGTKSNIMNFTNKKNIIELSNFVCDEKIPPTDKGNILE